MFLKVIVSSRSCLDIAGQLSNTQKVWLDEMGDINRDVEAFNEVECTNLGKRSLLSEDFFVQPTKMRTTAEMFFWATFSLGHICSNLQTLTVKLKP
jgi:hypothetical protein